MTLSISIRNMNVIFLTFAFQPHNQMIHNNLITDQNASTESIYKKTEHLHNIQAFLNGLHYFHPLSTAITTYLKSHTISQISAKKTLLLKPGFTCQHLYFIKKGAVRGFIKDGKREITTWITVENELVTSIAGLTVQDPSKEYIQCIEDCDLIVLRIADLNNLYEQHPESNTVVRKLLQKYYLDAENRAFLTRLPKADMRYQHFLNTQGHLANRIPLTYIASYLGITLETLSIVRKNLSKQSN